MGAILKLLLVVIGIGVAVKFGVFDQINELAREAALQSGVPKEQIDATAAGAMNSFSFGAIMTAIGTLPPPYGALGKLLFVLLVVGFTVSILAGLFTALVRTVRWVRDGMI